ncbi:MAG: triphosphoribosyl-dephospho-CoA synthase [Candidatus Heimdallarchaeaceae archaeon]
MSSHEVKGKVLDVQFYIAQSAVLAHNLLFLTEPKPGGASFSKPFKDTSAADFFSGGSALYGPIFELSKRGILVAQNHLWYEDAEIGFFIKKGIEHAKLWYRGEGNTILGTILMFAPLAVGVANFYANEGMRTNTPLNLDVVTEITEHFLKQSSHADCVNLTEVLVNNVSKNLLPSDKVEDDFTSFLQIYQYENTNLFEFTKFYEDRDLIFRELANKYHITIEKGYAFFKKVFEKTDDIIQSASQTFLNLLALKTDTHIAKRFGNEVAKEVKKKAGEIMRLGGIFSEEGWEQINELDSFMRTSKPSLINPGSTADLTATTLFLAILDGYRS